MPYGVEIKVTRDSGAKFSADQLKAAMVKAQEDIGKAVLALFRQNYSALDAVRSRGFSSPGFYARAANASYYTTDDLTTTITTDLPGVLHHLTGGTITAKNVKYLTIPNSFADPAVYQEAATNVAPLIDGLRFIPLKGPKAEGALVKGKGKEMQIYFWLVRSVTHAPDQSVIPRADLIMTVAAEALRQSLRQQLS